MSQAAECVSDLWDEVNWWRTATRHHRICRDCGVVYTYSDPPGYRDDEGDDVYCPKCLIG